MLQALAAHVGFADLDKWSRTMIAHSLRDLASAYPNGKDADRLFPATMRESLKIPYGANLAEASRLLDSILAKYFPESAQSP